MNELDILMASGLTKEEAIVYLEGVRRGVIITPLADALNEINDIHPDMDEMDYREVKEFIENGEDGYLWHGYEQIVTYQGNKYYLSFWN